MDYGTRCLTNKGLEGEIDGIIDEDELGLFQIYIQAKRYKDSSNITSQEIQQFIGAISNKNTKKGVFITTAKFTKNAEEFAKKLSKF